MTTIDASVFFKDTGFAPADDGGLVVRPSLLTVAGVIAVRVGIAFGLGFTYFSLYPRWHLSIFVVLLPLVILSASIGKLVLRTRGIEYEIRGDKFIYREGWLSRHMGAVNIGRIQNADVSQSVFERFFGIGTIAVNTDDSTARLIWMVGMREPDKIRAAILEASEAVRSARGLIEFVRT